jgi:hypothetical protein
MSAVLQRHWDEVSVALRIGTPGGRNSSSAATSRLEIAGDRQGTDAQ